MARKPAAAKMPSQRQLRAGEIIRHALADILSREDLRDPDLTGVIITVGEVRCSPDLRRANVATCSRTRPHFTCALSALSFDFAAIC